MSNTLPVPSKGALRALRNIALGTSCTVAVSAGLLTEDRRRRIHAARAVQQNGQRIKCSKSYHEQAGATAIAALEEHVLSPEYFTSTEDRHVLPPPGTWKSQPIKTHFAHETPTSLEYATTAPPAIPKGYSLASFATEIEQPYGRGVIRMVDALLAKDTLSGRHRSINVIKRHLRKDGQSRNDPSLVEACGRIYNSCAQNSTMQEYLPLLQEFLSMKPVSEELYYTLHAPETALALLDLMAREVDTVRAADYLNAALSIFQTDFDSRKADKYVKNLAKKLCIATYDAQMYDETVKVCESFMRRFGSYFTGYSKYLVLAHHELGNDRKVLKHFERDFATTTSRSKDQYLDFDRVGSVALDSALKTRWRKAAFKVLRVAVERARAGGFKIKAEWFNKSLNKQWTDSKDIWKTKARADMLEEFIDVLHMPEAFYCAMLQFCVEAGDSEMADQYMDKITAIDGISPLVQARASGHVALGSAMRGDWNAVGEILKGLLSQQTSPAERDIISKIFVPLFKLYAGIHDARQTEHMLRAMLENGMPLHRYTSNIMVNKFAASRDAESVSRWLDEIPLWGLNKPDVATYNTILANFRDEFAMSFDDLVKCVQEVQARHSEMVDGVTFKILRDAAIRESKGNRVVFARFLYRIEKLGIRGKTRDGWQNDEDIMREATAKGSNVTVLRQYEHAMADPDSHISPVMLGWAIKACLNLGGQNSHETAIQMLDEAKQKGVDIISGATRLLLWQLDQADGSRDAVQMTIETFARHGLEMPKRAILHVGNMLCNRNKHKQALDAWERYVDSSGMRQQDVDIACLTLLLRIHIVIKDPAGLDNIMQTMSENHIIPDQAFMMALNNGRRKQQKQVTEAGGSSRVDRQTLDFLEFLQRLCGTLKAQRAAQLTNNHAAAAKLLDIMGQAVKDDAQSQQEVSQAVNDDAISQQKGDQTEIKQAVTDDTSSQRETDDNTVMTLALKGYASAQQQGEEVKSDEPAVSKSLRTCKTCKKDKPRISFEKKGSVSNSQLYSSCVSCRIANVKARGALTQGAVVRMVQVSSCESSSRGFGACDGSSTRREPGEVGSPGR